MTATTSAEDIYDRPRSEFVARFIGGSNILNATVLDANSVSLSGAPLRVTGGPLKAGDNVAVSIRQHQIGLFAHVPEAAANVVPATVRRQVFLGSSRDYTVALADNSELRVTAPADLSIAPGADVWLHLPAERCRALAGG